MILETKKSLRKLRTLTSKQRRLLLLSKQLTPSGLDLPWTTQCFTMRSWAAQTTLANWRNKLSIQRSLNLTHWRKMSTETAQLSCNCSGTTLRCGQLTWKLMILKKQLLEELRERRTYNPIKSIICVAFFYVFWSFCSINSGSLGIEVFSWIISQFSST